MWQCSKCDALNTGLVCAVCKEPVPDDAERSKTEEHVEALEQDGYIYIDDKDEDELNQIVLHKKRKPIVFISIILVVVAIIVSTWLVVEDRYNSGIANLESGNYDLAFNKFQEVIFYKDANHLSTETLYQKATYLLINNDMKSIDTSKNIFESIISYKDSQDKLLDAKYKKAELALAEGDLLTASKFFNEVKTYRDVTGKVEDVRSRVYSKAIELYRMGKRADARSYFDTLGDYKRTADYIILLDASNSLESVKTSMLIPLVDFENTKQLLLQETYFPEYIIGRWQNINGMYIEYVAHSSGNMISNYNLPSDKGRGFMVKDGVHYAGDSEDTMMEQFKFKIITANQIEVYCFKDKNTYVLLRQTNSGSAMRGGVQ